MTESPFVKAEGPEPPDVVDHLGEKHRETWAELGDTLRDQLAKQSIVNIPENTAEILTVDRGIMFTADPRSIYSKKQVQPDSAEVPRLKTELASQRNKLTLATDELNRISNSLSRAETRLFHSNQLIGQLVGYLDSIEWGTHDEWTRSQSLRERAHEYLTGSNTIAT